MGASPLNGEQLDRLQACTSAVKSRCRGGPIPRRGLRRLENQLAALRVWAWVDSLEVLDAYALSPGSYRRSADEGALVLFQVRSAGHEVVRSTRTGAIQPIAHPSVELYCAVCVTLGAHFGKVLMRPERWVDKVAEWFASSEVDFDDHPVFSRKYYVLSSDHQALRGAATHDFLEAIARRDHLLVEIHGPSLTACRHRILTVDDAADLVGLGQELLGSA